MALVPAGGGDYSQFDEDGFDFGDEEQGEEIDTVNSLPEPTLAQVYAVSSEPVSSEPVVTKFSGKRREKSDGSSRPRKGNSHCGSGGGGGWRKGKSSSLNHEEEVRVAAVKGKLDVIKEVLKNGFNVDTPLKGGWTGLLYACNHGNSDVVHLLLEHGANPNTQKDMFTPLMAVGSSKTDREDDLVECARALVDKGARPNAHNRHQMTALMYACQSRHAALASYLIPLSDTNRQDTYGWSALSYTAHNGEMLTVKQLLAAGANPELQTSLGDTPYSLAYARNHTAVASLLDDAVAASATVSSTAIHGQEASALGTRGEGEGGAGDKVDDESDVHEVTATASTPSSGSLRYGDLELFLMGLHLGHLVPLFQSHQIKFSDLLSMTDHDLESVGVTQVGVRKTILDSITNIHKSAWKMPPNQQLYNRTLSVQEYTVVVSQLTRHVSYIKGTVSFLLTHVKNTPTLSSQSVPDKEQEELINRISEVAHSVSELKKQVIELEQCVQQDLGTSGQKLHSIDPSTSSVTPKGCRRFRWKIFIAGLVIVSAVGMTYSCYSNNPFSFGRLLRRGSQ